jgi:hypothetical protein
MDIHVDKLGHVKCSIPAPQLNKKKRTTTTQACINQTHHTNESAKHPRKSQAYHLNPGNSTKSFIYQISYQKCDSRENPDWLLQFIVNIRCYTPSLKNDIVRIKLKKLASIEHKRHRIKNKSAQKSYIMEWNH